MFRRVLRASLPVAAVSLWCSTAWAQNTSTLGTVSAYATVRSISITAAYVGDADADGTARVEYRAAGETAFRRGHRLMRLSGNRFVGAVLNVRPDTMHDLRVVLEDPDNAGPFQSMTTARTRANTPPALSGRTLNVSTAGNDATGDGSAARPYATIQRGVDAAMAGDTVRVAVGVYYETVHVTRSGFRLTAAGPGTVVDGSDRSISTGGATWTLDRDGIYWTPFTGTCTYLAAGDARVYDYDTLADLTAENGRQAGRTGILPGGFFVDATSRRLYVRTPDRVNPATRAVYPATRDFGIQVDTANDVQVDGFEVRYFNRVGIELRDAVRSWVTRNVIHHCNDGVIIRRPLARENYVGGNSVRDTSVYTWPWDSVKAHTPEASAVTVGGGQGNVVENNRLEGTFNGVYVGEFTDPSEAIAADTDVYDNVLSRHGDDGVEPEGACVNVRFWNNRMTDVFNGVSVSPIRTGPLWVVRTVVAGFTAHAIKMNNGPQGWMLVYHMTGVPNPTAANAQAIEPALPFSHFISRNNVFVGNRYSIEMNFGGTLGAAVDLDYDLLHTTLAANPLIKWLNIRYTTLADFTRATGYESHGVSGAPMFENAAMGDYTPAMPSLVLDRGEPIDGINDGVRVGMPDIGAIERGGVIPMPDGGIPLPDGSVGPGDSGAAADVAGGTDTGAGGGDAGSGLDGAGLDASAGADSGTGSTRGGCGCRVAGAGARPQAFAMLALAALTSSLRRRGRSRVRV